MYVLDPTRVDASQITGTIKKGDIPYLGERQFKFGYLPNVSKLQAGDLILISYINAPLFARAITRVQSRQFPRTAEWTHAAVFVWDWTLIEARFFTNVSVGSLFDYVPKCRFMFRRPTAIAHDRENAHNLGLAVALHAALRVGTSTYGRIKAIETGMSLLMRQLYHYQSTNEEYYSSVLCSGLYSKCVTMATGSFLFPGSHGGHEIPITPALLASASTLQTINVGWARLED